MVYVPVREACILGSVARTALGVSGWASAAAAQAGISRVQEHPFMVDKAGDPYRLAVEPTLVAHDRVERMEAMAVAALRELIDQLPQIDGNKITVLLGVPELGDDFTRADMNRLCHGVGRGLDPSQPVAVLGVPEGHAAGLVATERALRLLDGPDPPAFVVCGGVDSWIDSHVLEQLDTGGRLCSLDNRWGFPPGEGAAAFAVGSAALARQSSLRVKTRITAIGSSTEPAAMHTDAICTGIALADALGQVARTPGGKIDTQFCDINGERYREHEYSHAILRLHPDLFVNAVDYVAKADAWGDLGAATAPALLQLALYCRHFGFPCGPRPMLWCGAEGGRRMAMALQ